MADVTFVYATNGDWVSMYIDGELNDEGHSLTPDAIFSDLIGSRIESFRQFESADFESGIGRGHDHLSEYKHLDSW